MDQKKTGLLDVNISTFDDCGLRNHPKRFLKDGKERVDLNQGLIEFPILEGSKLMLKISKNCRIFLSDLLETNSSGLTLDRFV